MLYGEGDNDLLMGSLRENRGRKGERITDILPTRNNLFHKIYTKAENKHDSSGLGLSIAKELTLLHHGTIDFTSEEGKGTEFCVTLPLC